MSLNINDMGATRINQLRISFPYYLTGSDGAEFEMTVEAVVQFSDDPTDMKDGDAAHITGVGFGAAWLKFNDLPEDMRKAIEARAISEAYNQIEKAEL